MKGKKKNTKKKSKESLKDAQRHAGTGQISKPQKSRRHKKLKAVNALIDDPEVKLSKISKISRLEPQKKLPNQRPSDVDEQEIPRGISDISKWKEKLKQGYKMKRKRRKGNIQDNQMKKKEKGMSKPLKPVPNFKKSKGESDDAFMNRVERETQAVLQRSRFEDKYKVNLTQAQIKGSEIPDRKKKGKRKIKQLKRLKDKKAEKMKKQVEKKKDKQKDFDSLKDHVEFGEVAMEPPNLSAKPRKAPTSTAKPGKRKLLLTDLIGKREDRPRAVGKTVKRRDMSIAQQRILDKERDKVIQLYRQMKQKSSHQ